MVVRLLVKTIASARPLALHPPRLYRTYTTGIRETSSTSKIRRALNMFRALLFRHVKINRTPTAVDSLRHTKTLSRLRNLCTSGGRWQYFIRRDPFSPITLWARLASRRILFGAGPLGVSFALVGLSVNSNGDPTLLSSSDKIDLLFEEIRAKFSQKWSQHFTPQKTLDLDKLSVNDFKFGNCINKGCNAVVYEATLKSPRNEEEKKPFAIKMMFNYEAETNANIVFNAMKKECIIFPGRFGDIKNDKSLPSHPCIAQVYGVFADETPLLPKALELYPSALPRRLFEGGFGRNMTLFLVMKRYDMSLRDFLLKNPCQMDVSLKILGQLFEAVSFLVERNVVHRDIKSDNFLVDVSHGLLEPRVALSDFGYCLSQLQIYYPFPEISKGGNMALMPPEVLSAVPGPFSYINYSAADLWSVGTLSYEVYHQCNPFYGSKAKKRLYSFSYEESQLPSLPSEVPLTIHRLIGDILKRDPKKRPSARVSATVCHLALHFKKKMGKICDADLFKVLNDVMLMDSRKTSSLLTELRMMFLTQVTAKDLSNALQYFANRL